MKYFQVKYNLQTGRGKTEKILVNTKKKSIKERKRNKEMMENKNTT